MRCATISAGSEILAVGCDDGRCLVYDLRADDVHAPRWVQHHAAKVWVTAVSTDARLVAAGDYAAVVRVYSAADGTTVWEKASWAGGPEFEANFTWGLSFSSDASTLAIGHWDQHAYVIDTATWSERARIRRGDRVYCVALDQTGAHVALGGRDKMACVYRLRDQAGREAGYDVARKEVDPVATERNGTITGPAARRGNEPPRRRARGRAGRGRADRGDAAGRAARRTAREEVVLGAGGRGEVRESPAAQAARTRGAIFVEQ